MHDFFTGAGIFFFSTGVQGGSSVAGVAALPASCERGRREPGKHACPSVRVGPSLLLAASQLMVSALLAQDTHCGMRVWLAADL